MFFLIIGLYIMSVPHANDETRLQVLEEQLEVGKRSVETGKVRVSTIVEEHQELVEQSLARDEVVIERVAIGKVVSVAPAIREEGDTLIVPVIEEVLVVEKRLVLKEELRIRRKTVVDVYQQPVTLRRERAVIEREEIPRATQVQPSSNSKE